MLVWRILRYPCTLSPFTPHSNAIFSVDLGIADSRCLLIVYSPTGTRNRPLERVGGAEDEEA